MTIYECINEHGKKYAWIVYEKEVAKGNDTCETMLTENVSANFNMEAKVIKWWHEPLDCLCMVVK